MTESEVPNEVSWREFMHHSPLAAVIDLDRGPFACDIEASGRCTTQIVEACAVLGAGHVQPVLVTGASRDGVDRVRYQLPGAWWYAEHGASRHAQGMWSTHPARRELDVLAADVVNHARRDLRVTRTAVALSVAWSTEDHPDIRRLTQLFASWVTANGAYKLYAASRHLEVRLATVAKAGVLGWVRQRLPSVRCLIIGVDAAMATGQDIVLELDGARPMLTALCELRSALFWSDAHG